jgi:4-amino-4-deoxy-L-arabinose transferase-like glycosyltransferase
MPKKEQKKTFFTKRFLLVSFILLLIASLPRGIELLSHNYVWGFDQGNHYLSAKQIAVDLNPTLIGTEVGGAGGFFQGPGWYYLLALTVFVGGGNPYAGMIMMFLFSVATVWIAFYFGTKMFGEKTGFIIALLIATSPVHISQARFIWPPFPIPFFTVFFLYFVYKLLQGEKRYLVYIAFVVSLMAHFEIATAGTVLLQFILFSPVFFVRRLISIKHVLLSCIAFFIPLSPLVLFDLLKDHIIVRGVIALGTHSQQATKPLSWIVQNHIAVFKSSFFSTFFGLPMYWLVFVVVGLLGVFIVIRKTHYTSGQKLFILYLLLSPILLFLVFLLYRQGMWEWWLFELPVIYCFLLGIFLGGFLSYKRLQVITYIACVLLILAFFQQTIFWYKHDYYDYGGVHKIRGVKDALDYIYRDAQGEKFGLLVFTPPVYTYKYDYLLWWYGQRTYGYLPPAEKKEVFYLLIEPDPQKPWSYKGWMETVVKDGKVVKTVELPSGFVVQKRAL